MTHPTPWWWWLFTHMAMFITGACVAIITITITAIFLVKSLPYHIAPLRQRRAFLFPAKHPAHANHHHPRNNTHNEYLSSVSHSQLHPDLHDPHLAKSGWIRVSTTPLDELDLLTSDDATISYNDSATVAADGIIGNSNIDRNGVGRSKSLVKRIQSSAGRILSIRGTVRTAMSSAGALGSFLVARFMGDTATPIPPALTDPNHAKDTSSDNTNTDTITTKSWRNHYAVLRHKSLCLYTDETMLECIQIVLIPHYRVAMYPPECPDSEMYLRKHPISLTPRKKHQNTSRQHLHTLYIYAPTGSDKEDWFFMLRRSSKLPAFADADALSAFMQETDPMRAYTDAMQKLIQNTIGNTSNETGDGMQTLSLPPELQATAWLNALVGRAFVAIHANPHIKKWLIYRLMRRSPHHQDTKQKPGSPPSFLGDIVIQDIHVGTSLPVLSNPKLITISITGDMHIEMDINYTGGVRVEASTLATVTIPAWQSIMKPVTIPITIAVRIVKFTARLLIKIKPYYETSRIWFGFYRHPELKLELEVEPVISNRLIKMPLVNAVIEQRVKEALEESVMLPNMDDLSVWPVWGNGGDAYGIDSSEDSDGVYEDDFEDDSDGEYDDDEDDDAVTHDDNNPNNKHKTTITVSHESPQQVTTEDKDTSSDDSVVHEYRETRGRVDLPRRYATHRVHSSPPAPITSQSTQYPPHDHIDTTRRHRSHSTNSDNCRRSLAVSLPKHAFRHHVAVPPVSPVSPSSTKITDFAHSLNTAHTHHSTPGVHHQSDALSAPVSPLPSQGIQRSTSHRDMVTPSTSLSQPVHTSRRSTMPSHTTSPHHITDTPLNRFTQPHTRMSTASSMSSNLSFQYPQSTHEATVVMASLAGEAVETSLKYPIKPHRRQQRKHHNNADIDSGDRRHRSGRGKSRVLDTDLVDRIYADSVDEINSIDAALHHDSHIDTNTNTSISTHTHDNDGTNISTRSSRVDHLVDTHAISPDSGESLSVTESGQSRVMASTSPTPKTETTTSQTDSTQPPLPDTSSTQTEQQQQKNTIVEALGSAAYNLGILTRQYGIDHAATTVATSVATVSRPAITFAQQQSITYGEYVKGAAVGIGLKAIDRLGLAPEKHGINHDHDNDTGSGHGVGGSSQRPVPSRRLSHHGTDTDRDRHGGVRSRGYHRDRAISFQCTGGSPVMGQSHEGTTSPRIDTHTHQMSSRDNGLDNVVGTDIDTDIHNQRQSRRRATSLRSKSSRQPVSHNTVSDTQLPYPPHTNQQFICEDDDGVSIHRGVVSDTHVLESRHETRDTSHGGKVSDTSTTPSTNTTQKPSSTSALASTLRQNSSHIFSLLGFRISTSAPPPTHTMKEFDDTVSFVGNDVDVASSSVGVGGNTATSGTATVGNGVGNGVGSGGGGGAPSRTSRRTRQKPNTDTTPSPSNQSTTTTTTSTTQLHGHTNMIDQQKPVGNMSTRRKVSTTSSSVPSQTQPSQTTSSLPSPHRNIAGSIDNVAVTSTDIGSDTPSSVVSSTTDNHAVNDK